MAKSYPQLLLLGDSLIQQSVDISDGFSFQAQLQSRYNRRLDVVNRGFSGWTTANMITYLDQVVPLPTENSAKIDYLILLLGANDAVLPLPGTTQHIPIDDFESNILTIINHSNIQAHKPKILLVTPPPLDEIKNAIDDISDGYPGAIRHAAVSAAYSQRIRDIASRQSDVILIDIWKGIMDKAIEMSPGDYQPGGPNLGTPENGKRGALKELMPDGLHMSGQAYRIFYNLVIPHIGQEWSGLPDTDKSGYILPDWRSLKAGKAGYPAP